MGELEPPDRFYLQAATGWLELGNATAAGEELDQIQPLLHSHPDVLEVRFQVYAAAQQWDEAWRMAQTLAPKWPQFTCWLAARLGCAKRRCSARATATARA